MKLIFRPTAYSRWILSFGVLGAFAYVTGQMAMRRAARRLPSPTPPGPTALAATYMTGRLHWHQTAFAAWSLAMVLPGGLRPTFYDDGSLHRRHKIWLQRIFPQGRIVSRASALIILDRLLPAERFPLIRQAEQTSMFFRKLVTIRAESGRWHLYLDSDMLFFRRPTQLEEAARSGRAIYMVDHTFAYCLPPEQIDAIAGRPVPVRVNGGMVALNDGDIDWAKVERWLAVMPPSTLSHPMLEQTVAAMLVSGQNPIAADPEAYKILFLPGTPPPDAVLLHYIYRSKLTFLTEEWKRVRALHSSG